VGTPFRWLDGFWDETLGAVKKAAERAASKAKQSKAKQSKAKQSKEVMVGEQIMSSGFGPNSVRKVISVEAPHDVAWQVFSEQMGTWWPLTIYKDR